jgi:hypothetical protein
VFACDRWSLVDAKWELWIHDDGLAVDVAVPQNYDTAEDEVLDQAATQF